MEKLKSDCCCGKLLDINQVESEVNILLRTPLSRLDIQGFKVPYFVCSQRMGINIIHCHPEIFDRPWPLETPYIPSAKI